MRWKSYTKFSVKGLNQERLFNQILKETKITDLNRISKSESEFCVDFEKKNVVKSILLSNGVEILSQKSNGVEWCLKKFFSYYGIMAAVVLFVVFYFWQSQFVLQYEVLGVSTISKSGLVNFVKKNFSNKKSKIGIKDVENAIIDNFDELSFASCIIEGQTLILNVKEKLLPEEVFGQFRPIFAQNSGMITKIDLISGTAVVKTGDFVRKGDVLVEPFVIDTSGQKREVKANAKIYAEIYNQGEETHFEKRIETYQTGKQTETSFVTLFGVTLYSNDKMPKFESFEKIEMVTDFSNNNLLPLKMHKITYFETSTRVVESVFEDVKEEYVQKSREKALENVSKDDKIINEYYTIKSLNTVTIVHYCIVTSGLIGGEDVC